jgi:hypothetical protein
MIYWCTRLHIGVGNSSELVDDDGICVCNI